MSNNVKRLFERAVNTSLTDITLDMSLRYNFMRDHKGDVVMTEHTLEERNSLMGVVQKVKEALRETGDYTFRIVGTSPSIMALYVSHNDELVGMVQIYDRSLDTDYEDIIDSPYIAKRGKFEVNFCFDEKLYAGLQEKLKDIFPYTKSSKLNWYYQKDGRAQVQTIPLENDLILNDEYYPFLQGGVQNFINDYIDSKESILLLLGPPGTGKTSFIRAMICQNNFHACMTYDESIFSSDKYYMDYLLGAQNDLLVVEDADVLLEDRSTAGNKVMSKLLNVGDGLVKLPNKKMVFTTNLTDITKIDEAVMRPGRCFSVVNFRALKPKEAEKACEVAGLPPVEGKDEYTLADIFNRKENKPKVRKFGFM